MSLRPFFSYYGGKWRTAKRYPAPRHNTIVEPFAGSAGYSLRYPDRRVILCDADPVITGVWRYLIRAKASEILALPDVVDEIPQHLPQEARWLIGFWLNKATSQPCVTPSAWMRSGKFATQFWGPAIRARLAAQVESIRHWTVLDESFVNLRVWNIRSTWTWFVDPPYCGPAGRHYRMDVVDYAKLGAWCRTLPGQVIVCEGEGAKWLPFRPLGSMKSRLHTRRSIEQIWTNDLDAAPITR